MYGPNTCVSLWGSILYGFELQARYNGLIIHEIRRRNVGGKMFALMQEEEAEKEYTESLEPGLSKLAMSTSLGCRSQTYSNSKGRNTVFYPYRQSVYRRVTRKIKWKNYVIIERGPLDKTPTVRSAY